MKQFMPGATQWLCHYCKAAFWWHPGETNRKAPSECACGQVKEAKLFELMEPADER
jgi:hypothetical protein